MNERVSIALPCGITVDGAHSRAADLRELTSEEQLFLTEHCESLPPAQWTTEVLARCVTRLGATRAPDRSAIRALTVGDRDALLLHLHALLFGEALACEACCPVEDCGEKLEIRLAVRDLLVPVYSITAREHESQVADAAGNSARVRFRLPNGDDHEAAAALARSDVDAALAQLVQRCVLALEPSADGRAASAASLPVALEQTLSERMAELDPQAELLLRAGCPACGGAFRARFDIASFLKQRMTERAQVLYREVHLLAFHYHWSERDIVGMSARKRQRYLRLIETELARGTLQ
jgi:hypothetical protein